MNAAAVNAPALAVAEETPRSASTAGSLRIRRPEWSRQIFLRDTCTGAASDCQPHTALLSAASDGIIGTPTAHAFHQRRRPIRGFSSAASNLVANSPAGRQIYLRDTCSGAAAACTPTLLSFQWTNPACFRQRKPSAFDQSSGRFVAFSFRHLLEVSGEFLRRCEFRLSPDPGPRHLLRRHQLLQTQHDSPFTYARRRQFVCKANPPALRFPAPPRPSESPPRPRQLFSLGLSPSTTASSSRFTNSQK